MTQLEVRSLEVCHGLLRAVRGVDLDLNAGEVLAIVGANGAGKSTLLRAIAGGHRASGGTITFNGVAIVDLPAHERVRRGLCLVPEGRKLFPKMTVQENLAVGAQVGRKGDWTIDSIFEVFDNLKKRRFAKAERCRGVNSKPPPSGARWLPTPRSSCWTKSRWAFPPLLSTGFTLSCPSCGRPGPPSSLSNRIWGG